MNDRSQVRIPLPFFNLYFVPPSWLIWIKKKKLYTLSLSPSVYFVFCVSFRLFSPRLEFTLDLTGLPPRHQRLNGAYANRLYIEHSAYMYMNNKRNEHIYIFVATGYMFIGIDLCVHNLVIYIHRA